MFSSSKSWKRHLDLTRKELIWAFEGCSQLIFEFMKFNFNFPQLLFEQIAISNTNFLN